jgi:hypothetical protein
LVIPQKSDGTYISGITLKNIAVDGDRYNRTKLTTLCRSANQSSYNILARTSESNFFYSSSIRAGCGSALQALEIIIFMPTII